jgi:hypothetical protein
VSPSQMDAQSTVAVPETAGLVTTALTRATSPAPEPQRSSNAANKDWESS